MSISQEVALTRLTTYLLEHHHSYITVLLHTDPSPPRHHSFHIKFLDLLDTDPDLAHLIYDNPANILPLCSQALVQAQIQLGDSIPEAKKFEIKEDCHFRLHSLPMDRYAMRRSISEIRSDDENGLIGLHGVVVRTGSVRMLERQRSYQCAQCAHVFTLTADLANGNTIQVPGVCPSSQSHTSKPCRSKHLRFIQGSQICQDYQEIRVQENVKNMNMGTIPRSIIVVLQDDLVDSVQAGTDVIITGIVRSRWARLQPSRPCELQLFVEATHMECHSAPPSELHSYKREFDAFWLDHARGGTLLSARNLIVDSISPELFALSLVKLAVALCVTGGCDNEFSQDGMQLRGQSHLLLVGSPGTGKSQLLRSATRLCARSVLTTGIGTTAAGLSAACVRDSDGEMGLEAGALVLSDRGICCIDEFASIRTTDISTIHEAMEQQTISIAKAGIVCTLNTRATVLAAMNPRPTGFQTERDLAWNLGLEAPLLSRFDLVMLLLDQHDLDRDQEVAAHVLDQHDPDPDDDPVTDAHATTPHWPIEKLRAYFDEIKQLRPVRMSQHARLVLQRYYQLQRQQERSRGRTTIRLMESLIRLSQAHARLMYRPFVLARDAVQAVICLECSIHTSVLLGAASVLHSRFGPNPELEYQKQENIILKMLKLDAVPEEERNFNYEQWILDGTDPFNNEFVQHIAEPIDLGPDIDSTTSLGNLREPDDDDDLDSGDLYQTFTQCPPNIRPTFFK